MGNVGRNMPHLTGKEAEAEAMEALRFMREDLHWTQERIARTVDVSLRTAVRWLQGTAQPSPMAAKRILDASKSLDRRRR